VPKIPASERDAFYEARRTELARVALGLWAEQGYDQSSVAEIASRAGVSKGTFYLYFESKQALLEDVMRRNSLVPNVRELIEDLENRSLDEAVHHFVRGAWQHLCENRELVLVAIRELPTHLEQARLLIERVMVPANQLMAGYLEKQIDPTRAEQMSLIISARGLLGMIVFVYLTQEVLGAGRKLPVSEEQVTSTIAELFLHGIELRAPQEPHGC
jgi:AcrR family transcriptional regulator